VTKQAHAGQELWTRLVGRAYTVKRTKQVGHDETDESSWVNSTVSNQRKARALKCKFWLEGADSARSVPCAEQD
jgi:hypothetical protein